MSANLTVLQVFIASSNDLVAERRAIKEVTDELNAAFSNTAGLQIHLLGWEERLPAYGRAQAQINEDVDKADLFLGFLWRRWGSEPGDPKYTSGFEEEFNRAVERRDKSASPEISLFFKDANITSKADIDDQLRRVFEFRDAVASKKLLFGTFTNIDDWRKQIRNLLLSHGLKLLKHAMDLKTKEQPQTPVQPSSAEMGKTAVSHQASASTPAAKQQAARVWGEALDAIKQGELATFSKSHSLDQLTIARLGLVAGSLTNRNVKAQLPGVHLINLQYNLESERFSGKIKEPVCVFL